MMDNVALRSARRKLACLGLTVSLAAVAQPTAAPPSVPAALPRPPHQVAPDAPIQPDYYALALSRTALSDDPQWRALHLRTPGHQGDPAFIVLPVQTQAYGFSPTFRALLGARLDQELQRRHVDASRQTDIVDWRGPFVRRTDEATLAAFAAEHPSATLLALHLGHDADGHAFISLTRSAAGKTRVAHRRVDIPPDPIPALDALTAVLPLLLAELGLGDSEPAPPLALAGGGACTMADWDLADVPANADPRDMTCHALLVGTLMPDFLSRTADFTQPSSPDRQAWLARAWVEASALGAKSPDMRSMAHLAFLQLAVGANRETALGLVDDRDVVVRPLARMLAARYRVKSMPQQSSDATARKYVEAAAVGLPPFASAVIAQHAEFTETFHRVELCDMETALPHIKTPADCDEGSIMPRRTHPASLAETRLLESWRLAAAWSELDVEGRVRGSARGIESALAELSPRLASHPFLREMHFVVLAGEAPARGADEHLVQTKARLRDYGVAVATLQREDVLMHNFSVSDLVTLPAEIVDPDIVRMRDDLERLKSVDGLDFHGSVLWRPERNPRWPATFLVDGRFGEAEYAVKRAEQMRSGIGQAMSPTLASSGAFATAGTPPQSPEPRRAIGNGTFSPETVWGMPGKASFEARLAENPMDMSARIGLALIALEGGADVAEARRIVEAQPRRRRVEDALAEAADWALAGHAFYFAGELPTARAFYARAATTRVGSSPEMLAEERLAAIDGDLRTELARTQRLVQRYDIDWDVAHEAGLLFMLGRPQEAWPLLLPRAQTSTSSGLWLAALAGHRIAGTEQAALLGWVRKNKLENAPLEYNTAAPQWLAEYAVLDRVADTSGPPDKPSSASDLSALWTGGAMMLRAAVDGSGTTGMAVLGRDMQSASNASPGLLPFYAWAGWHATQGKDPMLQVVRNVTPDAGFAGNLAKAMVLSADGRRDDALRALTTARYELGRIGGENAYPDTFFSSPYHFVLASWLMSRKTGERAYADQGLAIARAYQVIWPYLAWPWAAEALLGRDLNAREIAACRAQKLDGGSLLLHESGLRPDVKSAACKKATAW